MGINTRRYSEWLLNAEMRLTKRRDQLMRFCMICAGLVAVLEAVWRWEQYTPLIPWGVHLLLAALLLPLLYLALQGDFQRKQQAFSHAMNDLGRRLLLLDGIWESEHAELQERYESSVLRPTQRVLDQLSSTAPVHKSFSARRDWFFKALPSSVHEADRMGLLSVLHPRLAIGWGVALALCLLFLPGGLFKLFDFNGLTFLVLLLPVYLFASFHGTRHAYELALYDWLRLG
jgi:hypothetical protein